MPVILAGVAMAAVPFGMVVFGFEVGKLRARDVGWAACSLECQLELATVTQSTYLNGAVTHIIDFATVQARISSPSWSSDRCFIG